MPPDNHQAEIFTGHTMVTVRIIWRQKRETIMAVIVKGEITITKGFDHWKEMVFSQKKKMARMGM